MGHGEQIFRLFPGQPVPQPSTLLPEGDVGQVRGLFDLFTRTAARTDIHEGIRRVRGQNQSRPGSDDVDHGGRSRPAAHAVSQTATFDLRWERHGHGADRHAGHREAPRPLSAVLLANRLCSRVSSAGYARDRSCSRPAGHRQVCPYHRKLSQRTSSVGSRL